MTAPRVLVVDDNTMNIELVEFVLESEGFAVASALDAAQARLEVARCQPDLILMDIQLPGMDGLALARELKQNPATSAITIVAFTAFAMKGDEAKMRAAGCDGYLSKPVDVARFAGQVRALLRRS